MSHVAIIANKIALPAEPPSKILIIPWGTSTRRDGQTFMLDRAGAEAVIANIAKHGVDLPIDLEHQTLGGEFASPDGKAPAVGWMSSPTLVEGEGLWVNTEWTADGAELLKTKQYRYISSVVAYDKKTGQVLALHSAGLTNKPAVSGTPALANKDGDLMVNSDETLQQARWFLNLPTTATETEIMTELEKLLAQIRELVGVAANSDQAATVKALTDKLAATPGVKIAVCKELGIAETAKDEEIVLAVNKLKTQAPEVDPRKYVSMETHEKVVKRLDSIETETLANKANDFITKGKSAGKITADTSDFWTRIYKSDPAQAEKDLEKQPAIVPPTGRMVNTDRRATSAGGAGNDAILANSDKFDSAGMGDYERVKKYQTEHKCSYEAAMAGCGL